MNYEVRQGDCVEAMRAMPAGSVDAVVTDPPYGLGFMGKDWDTIRAEASRPYSAENPAEGTAEARGAYPRTGKGPEAVAFDRHAFQTWSQAWATEALRVLKPGGHLLAFGGTRTYHRLVCAVEDAGFEIRDTICWLYGSGFPKSLDVGKAIDRTSDCPECGGAGWRVNGSDADAVEISALTDGVAGATFARLVCPRCNGTGKATREVVGRRTDGRYAYGFDGTANRPTGAPVGTEDAERIGGFVSDKAEVTAPATPEAERWNGWGTALKPAHEPVVVARKPLSGNVASTVLEFGTGALNVDGCRVEGVPPSVPQPEFNSPTGQIYGFQAGEGRNGEVSQASGRWPPNVIFDEEAARLLDEQSGERPGATSFSRPKEYGATSYQVGDAELQPGYADTGGASRFFYVAKASRAERNAGLEGFEERDKHVYGAGIVSGDHPGVADGGGNRPARNNHPTVKPISLMRWLVRLVTPPNGTVLDPFAGSGTTGCAAVLEGFEFIGLEREPEYVDIAKARVAWWHKHRGTGEAAEILAAGEARDSVEATGQLGLEL